MLKTLMIKSTLIALTCSLSLTAHALADTPRQINVPAGDLIAALESLARQAEIELVYRADHLKGLHTSGVNGMLSAQDAVRKLLEGTKLRLSTDDATGAMLIAPATTKGTAVEALKSAAPTASAATTSRPDAMTSARLRVAQAERSSPSLEGEAAADAPTAPKAAIPEVLVKGSRSLNLDIKRTQDDVQPYVVFDRAAIESSGQTDIQGFLRSRLTALANTETPSQVAAASGANNSSFNLRGLRSGQTLILIDGRRTAPLSNVGSTLQPDINGIPLSAIERIEVLPSTASGIYGGGATGGVINVVMRRDYKGIETSLGYDNSFDGGGLNRRAEFGAGLNFRDGNTTLLVTGSYSDGSQVRVGDRDFFSQARAAYLANDPTAITNAVTPPLGATTNICSGTSLFGSMFCDGAPLRLKTGQTLTATITSVPLGYSGGDSGAALVAGAGQYNLALANTTQLNGGGRAALLNGPTVSSLGVTLRNSFTSNVEAFAEFSGSRNVGHFDASAITGTFYVPVSAPNNPFAQDVLVTTPIFGADTEQRSKITTQRALAGLIVSLPAQWRAEADYTWVRTRLSNTQMALGLNSSADADVSAGVIDLFKDTNQFPVSFASYAGLPPYVSPAQSDMRSTMLRGAGPLGFELPGGSPTLTVAFEHRKETLGDYLFSQSFDGLTYTFTSNGRHQSIDSAYVELNAPVVSGRSGIPGLELLELTAALRRDEYQIVGSDQSAIGPGLPDPLPPVRVSNEFSSTDETFGLRFAPIADITFRGSYGSGFLPPGLNQLVPGQSFSLGGFGLRDPQRGGELVATYLALTGGNPDLRPERSKSRSFGVILKPRFARDLRLSLDWTKIRKRDNTTNIILTQDVLNNESSYPGVITRGPATGGFPVGPVQTVSLRPINLSSQEVEALDLALDYRVELEGRGALTLAASATRNLENTTQLAASAPQIEALGLQGFGKWGSNASIGWDFKGWSARWTARYFSSYWLLESHDVLLSQGSATVPSQTYHDLVASYSLTSPRWLPGLASVQVQAGVRNLFNEHPPLDLNTPQYYSAYGDPRLSSYFISLRVGL